MIILDEIFEEDEEFDFERKFDEEKEKLKEEFLHIQDEFSKEHLMLMIDEIFNEI